MKKIRILTIILCTLLLHQSYAQRTKGWGLIAVKDQGVDNNSIPNNTRNKVIVYISALEKNPTLIQYFHNEKLIGYTEKNQYLRYECEPGKQLFWSKIFPVSRNSPKVESFLELDLEANNEYYLDTRTYTDDGKNIIKSFKKDRGNLKHELVLLRDKSAINEFKELTSKKKPNTYKDKKLRKYNEQLYSQITTSLYEYNQGNPSGNSQNNNTQEEDQTTNKEDSNTYSTYSNYSTEILETSKQQLLDNGNHAAAKILQDEINSRGIETNIEESSTEDKNLETLEIEKQNAIEEENYLLAGQLKEQILLKKEQIKIVKEQELEQIRIDEEKNKNSLQGLINQKNEAINSENYLLAEELNQKIKLKKEESKIVDTPNNKGEIIELEKQKTDAIANEDYILAGELKSQIDTLKSESEDNSISETNNGLNVLIDTSNSEKLVNYSNNREESLALFIKGKSSDSNNSSSNSNNNYARSYRTVKISKSENNRNADVVNYSRSSLYTLMLNNESREHAGAIRDAFGNAPLQEKFNDHNIGPYAIDIQYQEKDQSNLITDYLDRNDIAKEMISKWFNRNEKGEFNTDLVAERGYYDASSLNISIAKNSERGIAILADAGEGLIGNTFVIVNDYKFTNKEEVAKKTSGWLNAIANVAAYIPGGSTVSNAATYTSLGVGVIGKGYVIKTTSYLYRLVWDEETAATFYNDYWIDENNYDPNKKRAFEKSNAFRLELIGSENAWADIQSTVFTKKSNEELIEIATVKATDKAIAKLQRKFEAFRTKSPLLSGEPITAKIGLKEGVEKGDKYEVLEIVEDKEGNRRYKSVGVIKVDKNQIWDNRFMANEENNSQLEYTTFKGSKNKFAPGMLIRQIN
jgi:hypothetical protein